MRLRGTPAAADDLERIKDYLREHQPRFGQATVKKLYESIRSLSDSPASRGALVRSRHARTGVYTAALRCRLPGTQRQTIEVLHIWHGAQAKRL